MYKCDFCGRESFKKIRYGGHTVCSKHMHQMNKYGKVLDNIPRTNSDLNDFIIKGNIVYFNVYNQKNIKIGEFFIDKCDLDKVRWHKWRISSGHIVTGQPAKKQQKDVGHIILGTNPSVNTVIDHKDGNPMNNTRENLRICSQSKNVLNKRYMSNNTSEFVGVAYRKDRNTYDPEIRINYKRCHLGYEKNKKHAVYKRYIAEELLFGEYVNEEEHSKKKNFTDDIPQNIKNELKEKTIQKLKEKDLWQ